MTKPRKCKCREVPAEFFALNTDYLLRDVIKELKKLGFVSGEAEAK